MSGEQETLGRFEVHRPGNGEATVYYDPGPHRYYSEIKPSPKAEGGYSYVKASALIGCSTPAKALDTDVDPLLFWAAGLDQVGVAELLGWAIDRAGEPEDLRWLTRPGELRKALEVAGLTWNKVRDRTATRGTKIHEQIFAALAAGGRPPSLADLEPDERGYGQAAMRWWQDRQPRPIAAEQVTVDLERRVAGRFDLLAEIGSTITPERMLVDAKTREKGAVRRSDHVQLAGYELANRACGIGGTNYQLALILKPDGSYEEHSNLAEPEDFEAALNAYRRGTALAAAMRAAERKRAAEQEAA